MKLIIYVVLIAVLISGVAYYSDDIMNESPVMHIDLSIIGDYDNPVIDANNTDRTVEMMPILKQNRNTNVITENAIIFDAYYDQQKITSNSVYVPYYGAGNNYSLTLLFRDDVRLPTSDQESVIMQITFINEAGKAFNTKYMAFRWVNSTEFQ